MTSMEGCCDGDISSTLSTKWWHAACLVVRVLCHTSNKGYITAWYMQIHHFILNQSVHKYIAEVNEMEQKR